jgi:hypothetical protein
MSITVHLRSAKDPSTAIHAVEFKVRRASRGRLPLPKLFHMMLERRPARRVANARKASNSVQVWFTLLAMLPHLGQVNTTIPLVLPHGAK